MLIVSDELECPNVRSSQQANQLKLDLVRISHKTQNENINSSRNNKI